MVSGGLSAVAAIKQTLERLLFSKLKVDMEQGHAGVGRREETARLRRSPGDFLAESSSHRQLLSVLRGQLMKPKSTDREIRDSRALGGIERQSLINKLNSRMTQLSTKIGGGRGGSGKRESDTKMGLMLAL